MKRIEITECPRDAMQGIKEFIPTELKIEYLNALLKVGFNVLDFGSFVSPKAIPQLRDTALVVKGLDLTGTTTKLLAIIANVRGGRDAIAFDEINILGFPFSVSEQFQLRNTNSTREQSLKRVEELQNICISRNKKLRVYLSMAFGNPYGEDYSPELVLKWAEKLADLGIEELALSDTTGVSNPKTISPLFKLLSEALPQIKFSAHFHSGPDNWNEKLESANSSGCTSFDSAIKGVGGCPMAEDKLVGNLATENVIEHFKDQLPERFNEAAFKSALHLANKIFG